jgi:hypothetical protein
MELHAIGIDLGKTVFTLWVLIRSETWSCASGVPARSFWHTQPTFESTGSVWKPAVVRIFLDGLCDSKATMFD